MSLIKIFSNPKILKIGLNSVTKFIVNFNCKSQTRKIDSSLAQSLFFMNFWKNRVKKYFDNIHLGV